MPIVVASSSCVWSAIAVIGRSPMRERRGPRTVVHIVGSRARESFFPHTVGSSTRIGVCPVVIGAPTVRLAEIVVAGCVALAAAAAAAITMRLRGRAAASAASSCSGPCRWGKNLNQGTNSRNPWYPPSKKVPRTGGVGPPEPEPEVTRRASPGVRRGHPAGRPGPTRRLLSALRAWYAAVPA